MDGEASTHVENGVYSGVRSSSTSSVFREENYGQNVLDSFKKMWDDKELCDVTLVTDDKAVDAHRIVLAASVPYFKAMFSKEWSSPTKEVLLKDVNGDALEKIVGFVYTGEITLLPDTVQVLLTTANYLKLDSVVDACVNYMSSHLSTENCLTVYVFARVHDLTELFQTAESYIIKNFSLIIHNSDFVNLDFEDVRKFVGMDQIMVNSEEEVFTAVSRWLQQDPGERSTHAATLFDLVRFPIIPLRYLKDVVSKDPVISISKACQEMIQCAIEYHQNPSVISFISPRKTQSRKSFLGHICLIGGISDDGAALNRVDFFIPHEDQWREGTKMNYFRSRLAVALCNGNLYAIGGSHSSVCLNSVERYSPKFNIWEPVASLNTPRRSCAAVVVGGMIFVLGGFDGKVFLRSIELFRSEANSWTYQPAMSEARSELAAIYHEGYIYSMGGFNSRERLSSVERFDLLNRKWQNVASMSVPRSNFGAALLGQEIFVCGGQSTSEVLNTAEIYSIDENMWEVITATMKSHRVGLATVAMGNKIYVFGGSNGSEYLDCVECYDPSKQGWIQMPPLLFKRFAASAIVLSKQLVEDSCR